MADYFTNFSLIVPLPAKAAQEYALHLAFQADCIQQGEDVNADFPASLREFVDDWHFDSSADHCPDSWGIWLRSSSGGIDAVCAFIQHLLQRFNPEGKASLEWSHDCSKPRTDAFGGGAALITSDEIKMITTREWLDQQVAGLTEDNPPLALR